MTSIHILIDITLSLYLFLYSVSLLCLRYLGYFVFDSDSAFGLNGRIVCTQYDSIELETTSDFVFQSKSSILSRMFQP